MSTTRPAMRPTGCVVSHEVANCKLLTCCTHQMNYQMMELLLTW